MRKVDDGKRKEWRFWWPLRHCQQSTARTMPHEQRPLECDMLVPKVDDSDYPPCATRSYRQDRNYIYTVRQIKNNVWIEKKRVSICSMGMESTQFELAPF